MAPSPRNESATVSFTRLTDDEETNINPTPIASLPSSSIAIIPPPKDYSAIISSLSNLSIQYNLSSIAVALILMDNSDSSEEPPAYPRTSSEESLLKSSIFLGAIIGQSFMGYLGDVIGVPKALICTTVLTFLGCLFSSTLIFLPSCENNIYSYLAFYRLITGIGVGGKYPLGSMIRADGCDKGARSTGSKAKEVGKGFFWQSPGVMLPYLVSYCLVIIYGEDSIGLEYKYSVVRPQIVILFGIGGLICFFSVCFSLAQLISNQRHSTQIAASAIEAILNSTNADTVPSPPPQLSPRQSKPPPQSILTPSNLKLLLGTGLTWMIYDFVYYGTALSQPSIISSVFGFNSTLTSNILHNIFLSSMGVPGVMLAIGQIDTLGAKRLMTLGFAGVAGLAFVMAGTFTFAPDADMLNFTLTCLLIFLLNWGLNVSTYVLPISAFESSSSQSTLYGLSAGLGKVGAFVGGYFFEPIADSSLGFGGAFFICGVVCLGGVAVAHLFIEPFEPFFSRCSCGRKEMEMVEGGDDSWVSLLAETDEEEGVEES